METEFQDIIGDFNGSKVWMSQRVDDDDGEIRYEASGPKDSFIVFHGPNAKQDCETFMNAVKQQQ